MSQLIFWVRIHITLGCNFCLIDQYWCSIFLSFGLHCSNLTHPIRSLIILTLFYIFTWSFQICEIFGPISKNSRPFFGLSVKSCLSFFHKKSDSGQSIFVIWSFASVFCNLMLWGATALTVKHFFKKIELSLVPFFHDFMVHCNLSFNHLCSVSNVKIAELKFGIFLFLTWPVNIGWNLSLRYKQF